MHGQGTFIWKDQKKYFGQFIMDKREGQGTLLWPDGRKFTGEWQAGR